MANPPGMKTVHLEVNETDAVHVYCDADEIWLQLRRHVPTEENLEKPSFKAALAIKPKHAQELGLELLNAAQRFYKKRRAEQQAEKKKKEAARAATSGSNVVPLKVGKV